MVFRHRAVRIAVMSSITATTIYVAGGLYGALFMTHLPLDRGNCVTVVNSERNDGSLTQRCVEFKSALEKHKYLHNQDQAARAWKWNTIQMLIILSVVAVLSVFLIGNASPRPRHESSMVFGEAVAAGVIALALATAALSISPPKSWMPAYLKSYRAQHDSLALADAMRLARFDECISPDSARFMGIDHSEERFEACAHLLGTK